ncbi:MAG: hypothetical protein IJB42_03000 [Oscillospiraceae bacterium]|nr:hypothetical protein [Oscillospiraceae bacterium]MBQ3224654.1 hypothetical protein [Oscillospiraceae bacterium]MBQ4315784.1 hypothetical protein [Oscillospiraceae bacterium]MBQ7054694.1 hypothetical protein [Oscillospiraceae bacterium]
MEEKIFEGLKYLIYYPEGFQAIITDKTRGDVAKIAASLSIFLKPLNFTIQNEVTA